MNTTSSSVVDQAKAGTHQAKDSSSEISWDELFQFQKDCRKTNKITGPAFLRQLNLPGVLLPYLYSNSRQPSKKTSSLGGKLRAAIIDLRTNPPSHFEISSQEDYLEEYYIKNKDDFTACGVFAVNIEEGELEIFSEKDIDLLKAKELFAGFETDHANELIDRLRVNVFFPAAKY